MFSKDQGRISGKVSEKEYIRPFDEEKFRHFTVKEYREESHTEIGGLNVLQDTPPPSSWHPSKVVIMAKKSQKSSTGVKPKLKFENLIMIRKNKNEDKVDHEKRGEIVKHLKEFKSRHLKCPKSLLNIEFDRLRINRIYCLSSNGKDAVEEFKKMCNEPFMSYMVPTWLEESEHHNMLRLIIILLYYLVFFINFMLSFIKIFQIWYSEMRNQWLYHHLPSNQFDCNEISFFAGQQLEKLTAVFHFIMNFLMLLPHKIGTEGAIYAFLISEVLDVLHDMAILVLTYMGIRAYIQEYFTNQYVFALSLIHGVLSFSFGIYHYFQMTRLLEKRILDAASSVFKLRHLNNQIIYNNLSGFMRRKFACRKADAIQKCSIIQKIDWYHQKGIFPEENDIIAEVRMTEETLRMSKMYPTEILLEGLKSVNQDRDRALENKGFAKPDYGEYLQGEKKHVKQTKKIRKSVVAIKDRFLHKTNIHLSKVYH